MAVAAPRPTILQQARLAQMLTVGWMVIEAAIAIGAGLVAHSVALTAFGVDSGVELFSSVVVLNRLVQRSESEERGSLSGGERRASRLVGYALYGLIAYIALSAGVSLLLRIEPQRSPIGIVLTLASLGIMAVLWRWRLELADRLGSPALRGDAACSMVCLYMAAVALGGLVLNQLFGLWWADPLAAVALVWWIRGEAKEAVEAGRT
ncbi:MAG TPA: cation transporter [Candidatus Acidoferrum sp.]|jgi:divalent metal cation (Fe/Co/Zn/Cd) transporter|nr:cation transporter [Candidatus Acidoferrum sp.]